MNTTTATLWVGKNSLEQVEAPLPEPPDEGLLLEVEANGICGSDLHFVSREPAAPLVLGHEIVGRIVAFGAGHPRTDAGDAPLGEGDTVALFPWVPCHRCWSCRRFGPGAATCEKAFVYGVPLDEIGLAAPRRASGDSVELTGGFGRHVAVRAGTYLWKVPPHLPAAVASLLDPLAVAVRGVDMTRTATGTWDEVLTPDSTAVVLGAGAVGLLTGLVLRAQGVGTVIVTGSRSARLAAARDIGMDLVIDRDEVGESARRDAVLDLTGGRGADLVIDATNSPAALGEALAMVRRLGTVVELGNIVPDGSTVAVDPARDICQRNVRLLGMSFNPPRSYSEAMALLGRHHDIPFERLITGSYTLDHVAEALRDISSDGVKVVLTA